MEVAMKKAQKPKKRSKLEILAEWRQKIGQKRFEIITFLGALGFRVSVLEEKSESVCYSLGKYLNLKLEMRVNRTITITWELEFVDSDKQIDSILPELEGDLRQKLSEKMRFSGFKAGMSPDDIDFYEIKIKIAKAAIIWERSKLSLFRFSDQVSKIINLGVDAAISNSAY